MRGVRGSGRTTLAAAWSAQRRRHGSTTAWIDGRPRFAQEQDLVAALAEALRVRPRGEGLDALAGVLLEREGPIDVVLDDADAYISEPLLRSLGSLVTRVPSMTVLIIGRRPEPISTVALDLPSGELHATVDELGSILDSFLLDLGAEEIEQLHAWFGGWLVPTLSAARAWSASLGAGHPDELARRTAREAGSATALEIADSEAGAQLLGSLWLWRLAGDEMTPQAAAAAWDRPEPMPMILALAAEGAVVVVDGTRPRWRVAISEVLADALSARFETEEADCIRAAHRRLSDLALAEDRVADALRHASLSQDWEHTAALLIEHWASLLASHKSVVREALRALPEEFVDRYPRWAQARVYVERMPFPGTARPVQFTAPRREATDLMDVLATTTARLSTDRFAGRLTAARAAVEDLAEIVAEVSPDRLEPLLPAFPDLRTQWARTFFFSGALGRARSEYERTYDEALTHDNLRIAVGAAGSLALVSALAGRTDKAEIWLERIPEYPSSDAPDTVHAVGHLARALVALNTLDVQAAEVILRDQADITDASEYAAIQASIFALIAGWRGNPIAALHTLRSERDAAGSRWSSGLNAVVLADTESTLLVLAGRYNDAARALEIAVDDDVLQDVLLVGRARTGLAAGHPDAAEADSRTALERPVLSARSAITAHLVLAGALHAAGDRDAADASARTAVALAAQYRLPSAFAALALPDLEEIAQIVPEEVLVRLRSMSLPRKAERPLPALTPREREILGQLIAGLTVDGMADAAFVSRNTVKAQIRVLYRKLDVHSRREAIDRARDAGLISG
ncbi:MULTISPECIES: LuxR C-terminal-related transcriptional regulator [unclassified Rathayibacter]|uniref:LuxR C-terminal-related transcriptional regulator n=1 Tax=unclassified Rathayibacter TaxID=2609250 RepID=UPI0006F79313|nr:MULTISPECIES: LuxR C-terminal-related transcriptional regulator [unclassified Rathayibacter]KQQ05549.1 hypothetical protein ASF42_02965 [Rathayibacter sp. Leaf294]KQS13412.1 hypothetical protein ASG06_02980 [Rathayibacter sp. Leaf185]